MWRLKPFFQRCKTFIDKIPRKLQVLINLVLIAAMLFGIYVYQGCPCFTREQAYRRLENANSIGPAQILGCETVGGILAKEIVVAKTQYGVILSQLYPQSNRTFVATQLFYVEKTGDITVTPTPQDLHWELDKEEMCLSILVFDEYPQAKRAILDFSIFLYGGLGKPNEYEENISLEAFRTNDGYFRFDMPFHYNKYEVDKRAEAIFQLSRVFYYPTDWKVPENAYPATVRLYDANNHLIAEKQMQLLGN